MSHTERHLNEEQLVLFYYGEANTRETDEHLAACDDCRRQYQSLQRVLNTVDSLVVPERAADFEEQIWEGLQPHITQQRKREFWSLNWVGNKWAAAGMVAALVLFAFLAGRSLPIKPAGEQAGNRGAVRERVLLVAVGNHLERSQMVLAEIANADPGEGKLDIEFEQAAAEDLLESNRLFRQTALTAGDTGTATLLDELERTLLEIAHSPSSLDKQQVSDIQKQMEDRGILFKVRVYESKVRDQQGLPAKGSVEF
jgi:hypothetical protein